MLINIDTLVRWLLAICAILLFVVVYLVKSNYNIFQSYSPSCSPFNCLFNYFIFLIIYPLFPIILTLVTLRICKNLPDDNLTDIKSIEPANNEFLPNYLSLFFVALAIPDNKYENPLLDPTFLLILGIAFILIFHSRVPYFNPIFLIRRYNFYYMTFSNGLKVMLISQRELEYLEDTMLNKTTNETITFSSGLKIMLISQKKLESLEDTMLNKTTKFKRINDSTFMEVNNK